nr:hypothetical protein [Tanacetum cinerariifolium]
VCQYVVCFAHSSYLHCALASGVEDQTDPGSREAKTVVEQPLASEHDGRGEDEPKDKKVQDEHDDGGDVARHQGALAQS